MFIIKYSKQTFPIQLLHIFSLTFNMTIKLYIWTAGILLDDLFISWFFFCWINFFLVCFNFLAVSINLSWKISLFKLKNNFYKVHRIEYRYLVLTCGNNLVTAIFDTTIQKVFKIYWNAARGVYSLSDILFIFMRIVSYI